MAWRRNQPARDAREYDDFHETMAPTAGYREPVTAPAEVRTMYAGERLVALVAGIINVLLAIRFVFSLINVNQGNGFASFIYNTTNPLTAPFASLFNYHTVVGNAYFDLPAIVAIVVVSIIAWALMSLLRISRI